MVDTFWRDRPTLVTGASGLVGSWLVKRLLEKNAQVICLVRDWVPGSELIRSGDLQRSTVVNGDVTDHEALERIIGEYEIDTVFALRKQHQGHMAAARGLSALADRQANRDRVFRQGLWRS